MNARSLFFTTAGTLRAPWRLLLFVVALYALVFFMSVFMASILGSMFRMAGLAGMAIATTVQTIAALAATWFCLRFIEKKPWRDVGLHREAAGLRPLGEGLAVGSGVITLAIVVLILLGWLDRAPGTVDDWGGPLIRMTAVLLPAALFEELIMRGYTLTVFRDAIGWRWGVLITSVIFGLLHAQNPGASPQSVTVVALAGIFLAAVRIGTDSLYAAWAAHFAWNWVMAALFHAPVSGFAFEYPDYRYVDAGPDWATGGTWGPESGVPAGVMMILATVVVLNRGPVKDLLLRRKSDG